LRKIFIFFIGLIIYGSLFPFSFNFDEGSSERWEMLFNSFSPFTSLGDILGNILLFIPFGFLGLQSLSSPNRPSRAPYLKTVSYGLCLAVIIQFIQVYVPFRSPSFADVYWNMLGLCIGMGLSLLIKSQYSKIAHADTINTPIILAFLWLSFQLFPFIPTFDFQEIKDTLKPLLLNPEFVAADFLINFTGWMIFAHAARGLFHNDWHKSLILPLAAMLSLATRFIIFGNNIDLSDVSAICAAILIWPFLSKKIKNVEPGLIVLLAFAVIVNGSGSLDLNWQRMEFSWLPFSGFLEGSLFNNTKSLFFKLFLYGSLIWLAQEAWPHIRLKSLLIFIGIFALEIFQSFMSSHIGEITDPLLIILLSFFLKIPKEQTRSLSVPVPPKKTGTAREAGGAREAGSAREERDNPYIGPHYILKNIRTRNSLLLLGSIAFLTIMMSIVIKLPGVPYNVKELFHLDGSFISLILFAIFILWFGMSIPMICQKMLANPDHHYIRFPSWVFASLVISFLLLRLSVTEEAMHDIIGTPTLYRNVTFQNMWGDFGYTLSLYFSFPAIWPTIWDFLEKLTRFSALFGPIIFLLCLFHYAHDVIQKYKINGFFNQVRLLTLTISLTFLSAVPWLYICKYIAFDAANTDNLSELISQNSFLGMGGGYLYLLLLVITLNAVWAKKSNAPATIKFLVITACTIPGWYLFNLGLEANIEKYGTTFSGVDFLLGPDRQQKLSQSMLFIRWIILYTGCVATLTWGMKINLSSLFADITTGTKKTRISNGQE